MPPMGPRRGGLVPLDTELKIYIPLLNSILPTYPYHLNPLYKPIMTLTGPSRGCRAGVAVFDTMC